MTWIRKAVNEYSSTRFDLVEVPRSNQNHGTTTPERPDWTGVLDSNSKHSLILIGSERAGLSDAVLALTRGVRIPMTAGVDSLNAAAASAVACHVLR